MEIAASDTSISIQIWHDVICPLCLIGDQRLQKALDVFPERDNVQFIYRSFRLAPGVHPRSGNEESGMNHECRPASGDTLDAHRIIQFAKTKGLQREVVCRFQRGYLEKASLFDHPTLIRLATEAGLDSDAVHSVLHSTAHQINVETDERAARLLGITRIPFVLVDNHIPLSGEQPPHQFLAALNTAWRGRGTAKSSSRHAA